VQGVNQGQIIQSGRAAILLYRETPDHISPADKYLLLALTSTARGANILPKENGETLPK
jgi:hypothetical protein